MKLADELVFCLKRCRELTDLMRLDCVAYFLGWEPPGKSEYVETVKDDGLAQLYADIFNISMYRRFRNVLLVKSSVTRFFEALSPESFRSECLVAFYRRYCLPALEYLHQHVNFRKLCDYFSIPSMNGSATYFNTYYEQTGVQKWKSGRNLLEAACNLLKVDDYELIRIMERYKTQIQTLFLYSNKKDRSSSAYLTRCSPACLEDLALNTRFVVSKSMRLHYQMCVSVTSESDSICALRKLICGVQEQEASPADCIAVLQRCSSRIRRGYTPDSNSSEIATYCTIMFAHIESEQFLKEFLIYKRLESGLKKHYPLCDWNVAHMPARRPETPRRAASTSCSRCVSGLRDYKNAERDQKMYIYIARSVFNAREVFYLPSSDKIINLDCFELEISKQLKYGISAGAITALSALLCVTNYAFTASFTFAAFFQRPYPALRTKHGELPSRVFFDICSYMYSLGCFDPGRTDLHRILGGAPTASFVSKLSRLAGRLKLSQKDALGALLCALNNYQQAEPHHLAAVTGLFAEILCKQPNAVHVEDGIRLILKNLLAQRQVAYKAISQEHEEAATQAKEKALKATRALDFALYLLGINLPGGPVDTLSQKFGLVTIYYMIQVRDYVVATDMEARLGKTQSQKARELLYGYLAQTTAAPAMLLNQLNKNHSPAMLELKATALALLFDLESYQAFQDCMDYLLKLLLSGQVWRQRSVFDLFY